MPDRVIDDSLPLNADIGTPDAEFDETLGRAIEAGQLDPALAVADARLAGAFAAHQKLESMFALLRGEPLALRERVRVGC